MTKNNVKATFFVIGNKVSFNKNVLLKAKNLNMAIYPHCNNHDYDEIYSSKEVYFKDLRECEKNIKNVLGEGYNYSKFVRMPGGSTNTVGKAEILKKIKDELKAKNIMYIDWNIDSGDANARCVSADVIKKNIHDNIGTYKVEVILMHDTGDKITTVEALQDIISTYKDRGYKFKTLNEISSEEIDYLKGIKVINN